LERQELTPYLQFLSEQGWVARRASFEGYVVGVELVKSDLAETQVSYCKQETQLSSFAFNKDFMNELKQPMLKYGWRELVSSKIIAHVHGSLLVISLWMKLIPKMPPVT
jgi:hypothetical protein